MTSVPKYQEFRVNYRPDKKEGKSGKGLFSLNYVNKTSWLSTSKPICLRDDYEQNCTLIIIT